MRACALGVLLLYPLAAGTLLLWSDGWAINRANVRVWWIVTGIFGVRSLISPEMFAGIANVVLFVPFFGALALLVPRWWWVFLGIAGSVAVELYQSTLPAREPSVVDVLTNTVGTALGAALGIAARRRVDRRGAAEYAEDQERAEDRAEDSPGCCAEDGAGPRAEGRGN